jgi:uncharacterized protein with GYD domain
VPAYLFKANYTLEGFKGVLKDGGTGRRKALEAVAAGLGGSLRSFHFAFGSTDAYVICDLPDNEAAAAASMVVASSGGATTETVVLLEPEEIDAATQRSVDYRPPGA